MLEPIKGRLVAALILIRQECRVQDTQKPQGVQLLRASRRHTQRKRKEEMETNKATLTQCADKCKARAQ